MECLETMCYPRGYSVVFKLRRAHLFDRTLDRSDTVTQTQRNALRLGADTNVACQLAVIVILLFN